MTQYRGGQAIASATTFKSKPLDDYARTCPRCGIRLKAKGGRDPRDGLRLCQDCRTTGDKAWKALITGKREFVWTSDEELERLEQETEQMEAEDASAQAAPRRSA